MRRECEFTKRYDPKLGRHVRRHISVPIHSKISGEIEGQGVFDLAKAIVKPLLKTGVKAGAEFVGERAGKYVGMRAGDKIVDFMSRGNKKPKQVAFERTPAVSPARAKGVMRPMSDTEREDRVNRILSGGSLFKDKKRLL